MQAANLLATLFKCGTWGFQTLAISRESRGERIFSACLQRSVFPSTILWEVPYLAGKNKLLQCKEQKMKQIASIFLAGNVMPGSPSHSPSLLLHQYLSAAYKEELASQRRHRQIHRNVSTYPNTSLNISAAGLFFLVVGNANSRLPRQKRGLNLGLLHARQASSWT